MIDRPTGTSEVRVRVDELRNRAERLLVWRVWERMREIEFMDRSVALAGKAFVSFFPVVIVIAAFMPARTRSSILDALTSRLGFRGEALELAHEAFGSTDDVRNATGVLGLVLTVFFATSFTTALQRTYARTWRRQTVAGVDTYWRGAVWLAAMMSSLALLGGIHGVLDDGIGPGVYVVVSLAVLSGLWWFTPWFLLDGEVRARVLLPTGVITGLSIGVYGLSATIWMPEVVTSNEEQFGMFGVALALVTWFSGAAVCILVGACAGTVLAEDPGWIGTRIRGGDSTLTAGARQSTGRVGAEATTREDGRSHVRDD